MEKANFKSNRILASLIDGFFMLLITFGVCLAPSLTFFRELVDGTFIALDLFWVIFSLVGSFLVWILYLSIPTLFFKGATLGMKLNHLTFETVKENDYSFPKILFREAGLVLTLVLSCGLLVISDFISIINNHEGRTFQDYFSQVKVVEVND